MINGLLDLPPWGVVVAILALTHVTIVAVTIYLHRAQAHRSVILHPAVSHFFRLWLWLTTGMVTREWVAVHRKHHAKVETEEDPHSPQVLGIKALLREGAEIYAKALADRETIERYGQGTPDDWLERHVYSRHRYTGMGILLFIYLGLFGVIGLTVWAVQLLWIPFWAAGIINGLGHYWGYRNYETRDAARNIFPWGILIGGEELHNNHHAFSSSAKLSSKWWEIDIGWVYLRVLSALGLARIKKVAPVPHRIADKQTVDLDTLRAVVINRLYVMADFGRSVALPVLREELTRVDARTRRFLRRGRRLLIREGSLMSEDDRAQLENMLQASQRLRTVYEYKAQLDDLWTRTTASNDKLLAALQEWCQGAERSGIRALQEFSRSLQSYSLALQAS